MSQLVLCGFGSMVVQSGSSRSALQDNIGADMGRNIGVEGIVGNCGHYTYLCGLAQRVCGLGGRHFELAVGRVFGRRRFETQIKGRRRAGSGRSIKNRFGFRFRPAGGCRSGCGRCQIVKLSSSFMCEIACVGQSLALSILSVAQDYYRPGRRQA